MSDEGKKWSDHLELQQTERDKWREVLAPSPCCTYECNQGRDCPARIKKVLGRHCVVSNQLCSTPYSCSPGCALKPTELNQANTDGSNPDLPVSMKPSFIDRIGLLGCLAGGLACWVVFGLAIRFIYGLTMG